MCYHCDKKAQALRPVEIRRQKAAFSLVKRLDMLPHLVELRATYKLAVIAAQFDAEAAMVATMAALGLQKAYDALMHGSIYHSQARCEHFYNSLIEVGQSLDVGEEEIEPLRREIDIMNDMWAGGRFPFWIEVGGEFVTVHELAPDDRHPSMPGYFITADGQRHPMLQTRVPDWSEIDAKFTDTPASHYDDE